MTSPELRVSRSGYGGSGYVLPARPGDKFRSVKNADGDQVMARLDENKRTTVVPGVTTVLKVTSKPGVEQFIADQTAAKAAADPMRLMSMSPEAAWANLRWYWKTPPKEIYDGLDVRNYWRGVLNDAAEAGTRMHEWVQADLDPNLPIPPVEEDDMAHWQMVDVYDQWRKPLDIEPVMQEVTVWSYTHGYAGTFDALWRINGQLCFGDIKTSRGLWPDHSRQLAALTQGDVYFAKNADGTWSENEWQPLVQTFDRLGFLHIRPDDVERDGKPKPAYCEWIEAKDLDLHMEAFLGALSLKRAELALDSREKERAGL